MCRLLRRSLFPHPTPGPLVAQSLTTTVELRAIAGEHVAEALGGQRLGARDGERDRLLDLRLAAVLDRFQFALPPLELFEETPAEQVHRVALAPELELLLAAVVAGVAARVA